MRTAKQTSQPKLTRAVIRQLGGTDYLADAMNHGADSGFPGFTYYKDTVPFFRRNRAEIIARLESDAANFGEDLLSMLAGFRCLKGVPTLDLARGIDGRGEYATQVQNGLAWYALEEVARELCDE